MQQFMVPQFIDVEDKILGPITVRQFVLLLGSVLVAFVFYKVFAFLVFAVLAFFDLTLVGLLAFAKVNGRPIHFFLLNFLQTSKRPFLRVWNREFYTRDIVEVKTQVHEQGGLVEEKKRILPKSKLAELSLIINTGGVYKGQ
ncbi:MAG: PrgI family protein [Candidatus Falkowbacteria bacterium]